MTHTEALNLILAHECPRRWFGNLREFVIELHCVSVRVIARCSSGDSENIAYDILRMDVND